MLRLRFASAVLAIVSLTGAATTNAGPGGIEIPFEKFLLDNGLTVLVHEDHKAPVVAVGVWYHVGSKDEPDGQTGFAHLFEHLMFEGSEHHDQSFSTPLEQVGATSMNGTTWLDRTNYFENVPTPALELALWLESDRMGHLLGAVTQEKLDRERSVVLNEKRQGDNQPYGKVSYRILEGLFPPGHPYRHPTIGSMDDLNAATLEDVHDWFKTYYGAANTVLVLAGDIEPTNARRLAERYFGHIPSGPPVTRMLNLVPDRRRDSREIMYDRVPHIRSYRVWAVPGWTKKDRILLQLAAAVLGDGKISRLYHALVHELQYAVSVSAEIQPFELASLFSVETTLAPGVTIDQVDEIVEQELDRFLADGPGEDELDRAKTRINAAMIRGLERVGGFQGKASTLAQGELYDGNPDFFRTALSWINAATTSEVRGAARRWLSRGSHQLDVLPFIDHAEGVSAVDRAKGLPAVGDLPEIRFPDIQRAELSNGIPVVLAEYTAVPVVTLSLQFDAGFAADFGRNPGTASLMLAMMDESTRSRSSLEIAKEAESLGAELSTSSDLDTSRVTLSALTANLEPSIELFSDVVRNPAFREDELERLRLRWLAGIEDEKNEPLTSALRILPPLIYGKDHPYGTPFTGSGTRQSVSALIPDDLAAFHADWIRPDNATLFVVGDSTLDDILPLLEKHFGSWESPDRPLPQKNITDVPLPGESRLIVIDKPGAPQSLVLAGHLAPSSRDAADIAIRMMNDVIGGTYSARINQNLRAEKQWSYGAYSFLRDARGQRPWIVYAPVQSDRTADAIRELLDEMTRISTDAPISPGELDRVYRSRAFSLPGRFETSAAILDALQANQRFDRPDSYVSSLREQYRATQPGDVQQAAERVLHPGSLTWVVVGDRARLAASLAELQIAELEFLEPDSLTAD